MGPIKIILNPIAGRGYGAKAEPEIRDLLAAAGLEFELERTEWPGHAIELAEKAARSGFKLVVAAGGDGTSHEVVNGLMHSAADGQVPAATLGVLPIGSGSDFAHTIGVPPDLPGACTRLALGRDWLVDVGRVTLDGRPESARFFDNTVGVGFDGVVTAEARKIKHLRGIPLYLLVVLKTVFLHHRNPQVTIEYDGQRLELPALMVTVANGRREGGGFFVTPDARPDDGVFDLCIAGKVNRAGMLALIPHFLKGTHVNREPITMARARQVSITSQDDLIAHVDGEILCTAGRQLEFEILPQRLRVWS